MGRLKKYKIKDYRKAAGVGATDEVVLTDEVDLTHGEVYPVDGFTASINNLKPEDIDPKKKSFKKKKKTKGDIVRNVILVICIAIVIACAAYLVWNLTSKQQGKEFYDDLSSDWDNIFDEPEQDTGVVATLRSMSSARTILCLRDRLEAGDNAGGLNVETGSDSRVDAIRAKLVSLREKYPDLYGWISIEGTTIDYPMMQGNDNDYYLHKAADKSNSVNGAIFVDYRNNKEIVRNFNTVIYGHNLMTGGMFHDVEICFYRNEEMFRNSYIYIYTMEGVYVYEPFAIYATKADYHYFRTEFANTDQFLAFANEMKRNSIYQKDVEFISGDRIITLSTCTNNIEGDGRYALQAKLVQVIY